ncbi:hypothetical protein [Photobacterium alginatilyticum]|uniref:Phage tail protein n=1 Tax=Photobacterium alginatilyticum TaxID=1775171 RepID=A0ABW9YI50_9GAMM|nr:hypothetical protein [Photobacterium alginatilyticum]NBI53445.1 hypothetical protein [Photobacterium alginatilyticum]
MKIHTSINVLIKEAQAARSASFSTDGGGNVIGTMPGIAAPVGGLFDLRQITANLDTIRGHAVGEGQRAAIVDVPVGVAVEDTDLFSLVDKLSRLSLLGAFISPFPAQKGRVVKVGPTEVKKKTRGEDAADATPAITSWPWTWKSGDTIDVDEFGATVKISINAEQLTDLNLTQTVLTSLSLGMVAAIEKETIAKIVAHKDTNKTEPKAADFATQNVEVEKVRALCGTGDTKGGFIQGKYYRENIIAEVSDKYAGEAIVGQFDRVMTQLSPEVYIQVSPFNLDQSVQITMLFNHKTVLLEPGLLWAIPKAAAYDANQPEPQAEPTPEPVGETPKKRAKPRKAAK